MITDNSIEVLVSEVRSMRVEIARLTSIIDRKRKWLSVRAAAKESGRSERDVRNAIARKAITAIPTVARGGKPSFKIKPDDLAKWMGAVAT